MSTVQQVWHEIESQVQNLDLESAALSVGTPLSPYRGYSKVRKRTALRSFLR